MEKKRLARDCIYCSNFSNKSSNYPFYSLDTPLFSVEGVIEAGNEMVAYVSDFSGKSKFTFDTLVIDFCPFCGKQLESDENARYVTHPRSLHSFKDLFYDL